MRPSKLIVPSRRLIVAAAALSVVASRVSAFTTTAPAVDEYEYPKAASSPVLEQIEQKHRPVASSFVPSEFNPLPAFSNNHMQTISGVFLRKDPNCAYIRDSGLSGIAAVLRSVSSIDASAEEECTYWDARERIDSCRWSDEGCGFEEDGDFFHVDVKYATPPQDKLWQSESSNGLVVVIHGLESNSNSSLSLDMANSYVANGFDVACLNFRGCCGNPNDTLGGYHLGFTDDLRHFLMVLSDAWKEEGYERRPIYLSGFSLGANVVLKALGELGETAVTDYDIRGCAVTGAPFDAERNVKYLDAPGFNRAVYSNNFLKTLKSRAQYNLDRHCEGDPLTTEFDYARTMAAHSVGEFDDAFIAKVYGFESNIDYYRKCSCLYFLDGIAVPTLIINAADDPFFDPNFFPIEKSCEAGGRAPIKMVRTKKGGHLGYLFHQLSDGEKKNCDETSRSSSWMPRELGRFIQHAHSCSEEK